MVVLEKVINEKKDLKELQKELSKKEWFITLQEEERKSDGSL